MIMNKEEDSHFNLLTRYSHYYVPVHILKVKQMWICLNVLTLWFILFQYKTNLISFLS